MIAFAKFLTVMASILQFVFNTTSSNKGLLTIKGQLNLRAYDSAIFFVPSEAELHTTIKNAFLMVAIEFVPMQAERDFIENPIKVSTLLLFVN
jgi:hypothetical protein